MSNAESHILKITVEPTETWIPVEAFLELIGETVSILHDLDANISQSENGVLDWEIVEARMNSPMVLAVKSKADIGNNNGDEVIHAYIHGISDLEKGEQFIPQYFTPEILRKAQKLSSAFALGISKVSFSNGNGEAVTATKAVREGIAIVLESNAVIGNERIEEIELSLPQQPRLEDRATLSGRLETISVHGKNPSFVIYDPLTNTKIDCFFKEEDFEDIQSLLSLEPYRVEVTGTAKYGKTGKPTSITVEKYRRLKTQNELPQFRDLEGINLTGDIDPTEYIRRLRDEQ